MGINQVSADVPAITAFGTALGTAGAGLATVRGASDLANAAVTLPTLGIVATEYAAAYGAARAAQSAGFASVIARIEDSAARAAATAASYSGTEGMNTAALGKESF
ncbi:MAG: hypothetical protein WAN89_02245 [Lawsonella sp.]